MAVHRTSKTKSSAKASKSERLMKQRRARKIAQRRRLIERQFESRIASVREVTQSSWFDSLPSLSLPRLHSGLITGSAWHPSKLLSLLLLILVSGALYWLMVDDQCFIDEEDVRFQQLSYLYPEELFQESTLRDWHTLWLDPESIKEKLEANPYVADAAIQVRLPAVVTAQITEVKPSAIWVTDEGPRWLLDDGRALAIRHENTTELLEIRDGARDAELVGYPEGERINPAVLQSALELVELFPELEFLNYNEGAGLNFPLPDSQYWIYWGDGLHFETKMKNLAAAQELLSTDEATAQIIDLRYLQRPYFR